MADLLLGLEDAELIGLLDWFYKKRQQCDMIVEEIGINQLDRWKVDPNNGNIRHDSGGFFEIIGVRVTKTSDREVGERGWTQPIIANNPADQEILLNLV